MTLLNVFFLYIPTPVEPWNDKTKAFLGPFMLKWPLSAFTIVFLTSGWPNNDLFKFSSSKVKLLRK